MKTVLALDTATEALSVALSHNDEITEHYELAPRLHAQKILPCIDQLLSNSGLTINQVDAFVFGRGPGAFTGLRTAIGVVQGLAFACQRPVIGVSTLMAMAQACFELQGHNLVITALDARMGEVYWAAWQRDNESWRDVCLEGVYAPGLVPWPLTGNWMGVGTGFIAYPDLRLPKPEMRIDCEADITQYPQARYMLSLALPALLRGEGVAAHLAQPVYLRDKVAEKSADRVR